ncbi:MAG TPA: prolyl oligopeptidase family serine peptidase [Rhodanobacteraceae bacterium]|nr:prolyl oligopeptidase family serine peptidase [Rhodanobacteraceae bacterium]
MRRLALLFLFVLQIAGTAHAALREVDPGDVPTLAPDQGLLLIAIDTDFNFDSLRIQREGSLSSEVINGIKPGTTSQLYVATAGKYYFAHTSSESWEYRLGNDPEFHFEVKAGVVNYPGDLVFRKAGFLRAVRWLSNRGLRAMDWIEATHPALRAVRFEYTGIYPDPFPDFYRAERGERAVDLSKPGNAAVGATAKPSADVEDLWRPNRVRVIRMNGAGDLVAEISRDDKSWNVDLINLARGASMRLLRIDTPIASLDWKGNRALLVTFERSFGESVGVIQIADPDPDHPHAELFGVPRAGYIVDTLPADPAHFLFASQTSTGALRIDRLDISTRQSVEGAVSAEHLALGVANATRWFADGTGQLRAAFAPKDGKSTLFYGRDGKYRAVDLPDSVAPIGLAPEGDLVYALADGAKGQRELVAFDPAANAIRATLFAKPGVDVETALLDRDGRAVGATYYDEGTFVSEYFDAARARLEASVQRAFPGESVLVSDYDDARRHVLLRVESAARPPSYFYLDLAKNEASPIDEGYPWLHDRAFAPTHVIHAKGSDGLPIEAYLTLPKGDKPRPLVVLAHGGPIGVRDTLRFDPEVQFIASLGYAVLQVNFRGSEGFGKAFLEAGKGRYGTLIEDDIDAALTAALAAEPLDRTRMCALGASYGGYSSLISSIRWPDRYRCVVSMMGISDRALFFTASDSGRSKEGRAAAEDVMGDPRRDLKAMIDSSPLYRYRELKAPLLLVHGTDDPRVDYEHTRRLARMLALAGRPPELITVEGAGHGFVNAEQRKEVWPAVALFLQKYLGAP